MGESSFGIREYTCSEKTKRPQKVKIESEKLEKRNSRQRKLYITLDNIDEIFSNNDDKWPVCYNMIFNLIQGKVTKYFKTRSYDRKKEISYDCINRLYSIFKRKLLSQSKQVSNPCLFFYLSQFWRYVDLLVFSTVFYGTMDYKYFVQEPEEFKTEEVINEEQIQDQYNYNEDENISHTNSSNNECDYYSTSEDISLEDNSENIKLSIEKNLKLDNKEKLFLLKLYKKAYQPLSNFNLTKKEDQILQNLQNRMKDDPELLKDLEEILNAENSTEN